MSDAELFKNAKLMKGAAIALTAMCMLLLIMGLFLIIKKGAGFTGLIVIPAALTPIILLNTQSLKELKKEMAARNL
ncbi:hypothetical protein GCM10011379_10690 [Filimonas zeae]|uniref:Redox-active disulfide protein 2 n=2 Tax=Filimonas zeae TaxID=1737353 RepID=A0A917MSH9_9BACT|nr:hypothetical protein GCM10011379_10690 [Filimonas zeae]